MHRVLELCARFEARLGDWRVVVALALLLAIHCGVLATRRMGDFHLYHRAAKRLVAGESTYRVEDPHRYLYAPALTFLFAPLAPLPALPAAVVWYAFNVWLVFASLKLGERLVYAGERAPPGVRVLLFFLVLRFIDNNLGHGQINLFLLWLILVAYDAASRGREGRAGLALAAAIFTKFFPLVLLLQLLLARRWKFLFATLGALVLLFAAPALWWGDAYPDLLGKWIDVLRDQAGHYDTANKINQSVAAFAHRLFRPYDEGAPVVELSASTVAWITSILHAVFLAALVAFSATRASADRTKPQGEDAAGLALYLLYATVASHYSWKYYFVDLLLPFAVVVRRTIEGRQRGGEAILMVAFLLNVLPGLRVFGKAASVLFQLWSFHFVSVVLLFVAIALSRRRNPRFPVPTPQAVC